MNKVVYVGTTYKCSACKCMQYIMEDIKKDNPIFDLKVLDYTELPQFIKDNVLLADFPVTVFIEDDYVKYHFMGTMARRKVEKLMRDIDFLD